MSSAVIHVVGAAIFRDGKCLITRRSERMTHALKWEFPGGKIEPGESPAEALRRELREELGLEIAVGDHLGQGVGHLGDRTILLDVYESEWVGGELTLSEHHEYGWFGADEVSSLDWPEADRPILPALEARLLRNRG